MAKRQHYPSIFENLSRVTTTVSDWDTPSLEGASADGLSQGDPALVDGSMVLDSPTQMLDRVAVVESEDESECLFSAFTIPSSDSVLSAAHTFVNIGTPTDRPRL